MNVEKRDASEKEIKRTKNKVYMRDMRLLGWKFPRRIRVL